MVDSKLIYWATVCDSLKGLFVVIGILSIIALIAGLILFGIVLADEYDYSSEFTYSEESETLLKRFIIGCLITSLVCFMGAIFVPSKETISAMANPTIENLKDD